MSVLLSVEKEYFLYMRFSSFCGEMITLMTFFGVSSLVYLWNADFSPEPKILFSIDIFLVGDYAVPIAKF
jgi:hypothetical protein